MYVKSLTLRGFKSFASATSMRLEPGITCIVGPNGSGKSNVVDALAWVMGEQGAKSLRGGKMEDVIFAGTSGRAPLGRAEVALTIDNTDGALPIDYTEVTIKRTMFRNGGSDYSINGTSCRLLDVQELLSDSGIGREMHVIVGQGQLDAVLRATPEERRGFIEEAAGVLKHRKRKETRAAQARDDGGQPHPGPRPHRRDPPPARPARPSGRGRPQGGGRSRPTPATPGCGCSPTTSSSSPARSSRRSPTRPRWWRAAPRWRRRWPASATRLAVLEQEAQEAAPELARAQEQWFALSSLRERLTSTGVPGRRAGAPALRGRRRRGALRPRPREAAGAGRPGARAGAGAAGRDRRGQGGAGRRGHPPGRDRERARRRAAAPGPAGARRRRPARGPGQAGRPGRCRRSRIEAGEAEIGRLRQSLEQSRSRAAAAEREFADLEASVAVDEEGEEGLDTAHERAAAELEQAEAEVESLARGRARRRAATAPAPRPASRPWS